MVQYGGHLSIAGAAVERLAPNFGTLWPSRRMTFAADEPSNEPEMVRNAMADPRADSGSQTPGVARIVGAPEESVESAPELAGIAVVVQWGAQGR